MRKRKGSGWTPQRRVSLLLGSGEGSSSVVLTLFSLVTPCRGAARSPSEKKWSRQRDKVDRSNVDSFKSSHVHENLSAAIGSAYHEVDGHGEEQGASCGEKKPSDRAAVDGEVPKNLDQSHLI